MSDRNESNAMSDESGTTSKSQAQTRELYLQAILDNFPFLVWLKDTQSRFLAVNKNFSTACGRNSPDEVRSLTDLDVWPKRLAQQYRLDDQLVINSQTEKNVEEPCLIDGNIHWIETFKKPVIAPDGTTLGTVGFARDITERKLIEQQLAESEERWELAIAGSNDGIWDWNLENNSVHFSDRWKTMLGYTPHEIPNEYHQWESRVHPEDIERVLTAIHQHLTNESDIYQVEFRIRCKDGSYRWVLARGKAIRNLQGNATRFLGSHSDIHDRVISEQRLRLRTAQLNLIFTLSPDGFVAFGENGTIEYASNAFEKLTDIPCRQVIGKTEADLIEFLSMGCVPDSMGNQQTLNCLRAPASNVDELQLDEPRMLLQFLQQGRIIEVGRIQVIGKVVSKIYYFRDVTRETEIDRLKSQFLSTAAHELRTPMVSIYGFSELLLNASDFDEETKHELVETIHRHARQMSAIINELLDLTKIEAKRGLDFEYSELELNELVSKVVRDFIYDGDERKPFFTGISEKATVRGDRQKLSQAFTNILSNAFKYSPGGWPITVKLLKASTVSPGYSITIADKGIGMSQETLSRVCERFYRADSSGAIPGTGLGMSLVKEIIELHGGKLNITSVLGIGSEITLWLPASIESNLDSRSLT